MRLLDAEKYIDPTDYHIVPPSPDSTYQKTTVRTYDNDHIYGEVPEGTTKEEVQRMLDLIEKAYKNGYYRGHNEVVDLLSDIFGGRTIERFL